MLADVLKILVPFVVILQILPALIWLERKGMAYIQDRRGPNRASIAGIRLGGLIHSLADVVKLIFKEDIFPTRANKFLYTLAPFIAMAVACVTFAVIPWADSMTVDGALMKLQAVDLNVGILYIFSITSLGVYGIMLAGWASNNKFSLMGGLRASSQLISYELTMGLSVLGVLILAGSLELGTIVSSQGEMWQWNVFRQPVAFFLFLISAFAETNRTPFDLPESDAELVAGYHTEYSSLKFALFMMSEYFNIFVASALIATLFFGGWQIPFASTEMLRGHASELLYYGALGLGIVSVLGGIGLLFKKTRVRYNDSRDQEPKKLAVPALGLGAALLIYFLTQGMPALGGLGVQVVAALLQFGFFIMKILFFCWFFIWVRWTLPRFRYDQLMGLGWRVMLPLSLLNFVVTAGIYLTV